MLYNSKQLPNGRWGIFIDNKLVASIGCPKTCKKIVKSLESRMAESEISTASSTARIVSYFRDLKLAS